MRPHVIIANGPNRSRHVPLNPMKRQLFAVIAGTFASLAAGAAPMLAAPAETSAAAAGASATSIWHGRADEAFAAARKSGKPVLVDLYARWCGWCKVMDRETFSAPRFQQYAERFVLLRVDVEDGAAGSELQRRFNATSLPTLLILDPKQILLGTIQGYVETDKLIARLDLELEKYSAFLASYQNVLASSDPALWKSRAQELHGRGDGARAAPLYERLVKEGRLAGDELSWIRLQLADAYRMDGRFAEARKTASALRRDLKASAAATAAPSSKSPQNPQTAQTLQITERVDLLLVFIAGGERDCTEAAGALAAFEQGHPRSPYLSDARRAYAALKSDSAAQCS
jgi:thiol-disulfide isomerase/thioredoxin